MPEEFAADDAIEKARKWLLQSDSSSSSLENDKAELLRLHKEQQTAHLTYNAELFVGSFADQVTRLQRGQVKTRIKPQTSNASKTILLTTSLSNGKISNLP